MFPKITSLLLILEMYGQQVNESGRLHKPGRATKPGDTTNTRKYYKNLKMLQKPENATKPGNVKQTGNVIKIVKGYKNLKRQQTTPAPTKASWGFKSPLSAGRSGNLTIPLRRK